MDNTVDDNVDNSIATLQIQSKPQHNKLFKSNNNNPRTNINENNVISTVTATRNLSKPLSNVNSNVSVTINNEELMINELYNELQLCLLSYSYNHSIQIII